MSSKLLICLCALMALSLASTVNCKAKIANPNGKTYAYDLSGLSHAAGVSDTLRIRDDQGNYIYANICGPSSEKCSSGTAVCMKQSDLTTYVSLGMLDTQEFTESVESEPGKGLQVTYSNGDGCILGSWQTVISLLCDPNEDGKIDTIEEGECWYRMNVYSKYACGKEAEPGDDDSGSNTGDVVALVILLVLLCSVIVYFVVGAIWQKKKNDASTAREYIIHNEFWCSLPMLIRDGFMFIIHGFKKGDYISV